MRAESLFLWFMGLGFLLGALWVSWTQTPLPSLLPTGVALAVGLLVLALASFRLAHRVGDESRTVVVRQRPTARSVLEEDE